MRPSEMIGPRGSSYPTERQSSQQPLNPLEYEYSRIKKELEQNDKRHEEEILRLKIAYQKEIQQIKGESDTWLAEEEQKFGHEIGQIQSKKNMVVLCRELAHAWRQQFHEPQTLEELILAGGEAHPIDLTATSPPRPLVPIILPQSAPSTYLNMLLNGSDDAQISENLADFHHATGITRNELFEPSEVQMYNVQHGFVPNAPIQDPNIESWRWLQ